MFFQSLYISTILIQASCSIKLYWKFKKVFFKKMFTFLQGKNLKYQSGFLPHHSTVFQLMVIFHNIYQAFDKNMFPCSVFCDVSKVFYRVLHNCILFKFR